MTAKWIEPYPMEWFGTFTPTATQVLPPMNIFSSRPHLEATVSPSTTGTSAAWSLENFHLLEFYLDSGDSFTVQL